jgi:polyisoprenyl-phosphate glycosyltransferase
MTEPANTALPSLCIIVPAYNEEEVLPQMMQRLETALANVPARWWVLLVDDGSRDQTPLQIADLCQRDARVASLRLARNFGKEAAMTAGLDFADADAVVIIDADLQDPPELIAEFWKHFQSGFDVVYGVRASRAGETWLKKTTASAFYRLMEKASPTQIPRDTGDFRLMSRRAVLALRQLRERHRFMKGLFAWVGHRQIGITYHRDPRAAGSSKFNFWKLWNFALEGITSFSTLPLRASTYVGLCTALAAFCYGLFIIAKTLVYGDPVAGFPTLMTVMLFLGGVQLTVLGVIGEYLGRLYNEVKQRPLYLVDQHVPAQVERCA